MHDSKFPRFKLWLENKKKMKFCLLAGSHRFYAGPYRPCCILKDFCFVLKNFQKCRTKILMLDEVAKCTNSVKKNRSTLQLLHEIKIFRSPKKSKSWKMCSMYSKQFRTSLFGKKRIFEKLIFFQVKIGETFGKKWRELALFTTTSIQIKHNSPKMCTSWSANISTRHNSGMKLLILRNHLSRAYHARFCWRRPG